MTTRQAVEQALNQREAILVLADALDRIEARPKDTGTPDPWTDWDANLV